MPAATLANSFHDRSTDVPSASASDRSTSSPHAAASGSTDCTHRRYGLATIRLDRLVLEPRGQLVGLEATDLVEWPLVVVGVGVVA